MRRASHFSHSGLQRPSPRAVLGPDHPLVEVLDQIIVVCERCLVVAALLALGVVAGVDGFWFGLPLAVAAAVVLAALAVNAAVLVSSSRERALELIAHGRGNLAFAPVERQRQRLLDPVHRERLARSLESMRDETERWKRAHPVRPVFCIRVVRAAAPELTLMARLVRGDQAQLPGVAMTEQLLTNGCSLLYGEDLGLLLQELRRARFLLERCDVTSLRVS